LSCFGKNGSEGNTAVIRWRSALEADFSCSLIRRGRQFRVEGLEKGSEYQRYKIINAGVY